LFLGLALGVGLARRIGYKTTIFGGVCSMIAAVIIASFMHEQQGFTAMYCILCGVATGLMYMLPIACGWEYFPQSRGFHILFLKETKISKRFG
jgi:OFA family oxalate/formate antiporter-like MFS transporter